MKDDTHSLENSNETLFLVTNVPSLQRVAERKVQERRQKDPLVPDKNEIFHCPKCSYQTATKGALSKHKSVVHGPKNFVCRLCPK